jgi:multicomponent Na+:H+ antiporter subunit B
VILIATARLLLPVFIIFSVFLLMRGHDAPGGGFTGGLVASAGLVLYGLVHGPRAVRRALRISLKPVIGSGLTIGLVSALVGPATGRPFFSSVWYQPPFGPKIGTPVIFDIGVYFVVLGVVLTIMLTRGDMEEVDSSNS